MKYERVLLVNPYPEAARGINEATIYPPIGLAYIASFLLSEGVTVGIVDANIMKMTTDDVLLEVGRFKPDLVGISVNIVTAKSGATLSKLIKARTGLPVCIGGPFASSMPEKALELSSADIACIGEGEYTMLEICKGKKLSLIDGIAYKKGRLIVRNKPRSLIEDLDVLPYPAYDLLPPLRFYKSRARRTPVGAIITSRGCPYHCTYCNSSVFGKRFRARSAGNVIGEIDLLVKKHSIRQLDILDDNFTLDVKRADNILGMIIKNNYPILINLQNGIRADRLTKKLVVRMRKAGVFKVGIGIESGDERVQKWIKKSLDLKDVVKSIGWFRSQNIITVGFFILGFPFDDEESVNHTIDFALKANPSMANFSILLPFPGTEVYEYLKQKGMLKENLDLGIETGFFESRMYHTCHNLSEEKLAYYQKEAYRRFNLRIGKIIETLLNIRSMSELKWTVEAALPLIPKILMR
jgi:anaerobic magnesium-protoporphyrin IX monomethyl ester cyclase